jgi:CPW-WPC domain-containing protein
MSLAIVISLFSLPNADAGFAFSALRKRAASDSDRSFELNPAEAGRSKAKQLESILAEAAGNSSHTAFLQKASDSGGVGTSSGDISGIQESASRAQLAFDRTSSIETEGEKAMKVELRNALKDSHAEVGRPNNELPKQAGNDCFPDYGTCPVGWTMRGSVCVAGAGYEGPCRKQQHLISRSVDEKRAVARACDFDWPCQAECVRDFSDACPIDWDEVEIGLCEAPVSYEGGCDHELNTIGMSEKDKHEMATSCDVSWPCIAAAKKNYGEICPDGWTLQSGQSCTAPRDYVGPCDAFARLGGMTEEDKQTFEAACVVSWPGLPLQCARDYNRSCPFGWMEKWASGNIECVAPDWFRGCSGVQQLGRKTPQEKRAWATACGAPFPCKDRTIGDHDWSQICPADWFAMNGGEACFAPNSYTGPCQSIQHGLAELSRADKEAIARTCQVVWPSVGEAGSMLARFVEKSSASPNGPVAVENGAVTSAQ